MSYIPRQGPKLKQAQQQPATRLATEPAMHGSPHSHGGRINNSRRSSSIVRLATADTTYGSIEVLDALSIARPPAEKKMRGLLSPSAGQGHALQLNTPATRRWLGRLKGGFAHATDKDAHANSVGRNPAPTQRPWDATETVSLARTSHAFWKSGRHVDFGLMSSNLSRPVKDIKTMLRLMLQEYTLCAQKSHWAVDQELLVRKWAAIEFPKCQVLNPSRDHRWRPASFASVEKCLSLLKCRAPNNSPRASSKVTLAQSQDVVDGELVRSLACNQPVIGLEVYAPAVAVAPEQHPASTPDAQRLQYSTHHQPTGAGQANAWAFAPDSNVPVHSDKQFDSARGLPVTIDASVDSSTCANASTNVDSGINLNYSSEPAVNSMPLRHNSIGMMRRTPRSKKQRKRQKLPAIVAEFQEPTGMDAREAADITAGLTMPHTSHHDNTLQFGSTLGDADTTSKHLTDAHNICRPDDDIEMLFFNVAMTQRRFARGFVEDYIGRFFEAFYFRVAIPDMYSRRLYRPLGEYSHASSGSIIDLDLLASIEKEMLKLDLTDAASSSGQALNLNCSNQHFHLSLIRAIGEHFSHDKVADWPGIDAYATAIFNRVIEDTHFLFFEEHEGQVTGCSSASDTGSIQCTKTNAVAARIDSFKQEYYFCLVSSLLTSRYVQTAGRQTFLARARLAGYRPVPTAVAFGSDLSEEQFERELDISWSDVAIRSELHSLITNTIPRATSRSIMIAVQQSIEVYNRAIIERVDGLCKELSVALGAMDAAVIKSADKGILAAIKKSRGAMSVDMACVLGRWLGEQWFDRLQRGLVRALMADHQFMPVPLADVRRWICEDRSPNGKGVDFVLNTRLYNYLKHMRVLMNEAKWLYASAAATLRVIELAKLHLQNKLLLDHISVDRYASAFGTFIRASESQQALACMLPNAIPGAVFPENTTLGSGSHVRDQCPTHQAQTISLEQDPEMLRMHFKHVSSALHLNTSSSSASSSCQTDMPSNTTDVSRCSQCNVSHQHASEARLGSLEVEMTSIYREMRDVADMRHDINKILSVLRIRSSGNI
ncbi:hypothetical protein LPJ66_004077 [Kickxella alabastrina]|uniref:Uncharacterized protein n=1 Tax=Kickxella alabastrina TaxID=61397 RepID=A0ACC1INV7_9FUNG|nr:hypothetical protein LPJ66_004077 [Kickxella alabastrina]